MSFELINRITIKKDGIYISTHSSNDSSPYYTTKSEYYTDKYLREGQAGLDIAIINSCFDNCELRGNHNSILPYKNAINKAMNKKDFLDIYYKNIELEEKLIDVSNNYGEYKNISDEKKTILYEQINKEIYETLKKRNDYILNLIKMERESINKPKELSTGIYEIIPVHTKRVNENIYSEYMNLNTNNGTVIYEMSLGFLKQSPDIMKISEYEELINKYGKNEINGAKQYERFKKKYPDLYNRALDNEIKEKEEIEEERSN